MTCCPRTSKGYDSRQTAARGERRYTRQIPMASKTYSMFPSGQDGDKEIDQRLLGPRPHRLFPRSVLNRVPSGAQGLWTARSLAA
jgi:hypothetical protein